MSYRADRQARLATRRSLQTRPLRSEELSAQAVHEPHIAPASIGEVSVSPSLLFEALAARPPSEASVGSGHLDAELAGRIEALEALVGDLQTETAYLRGVLAGKGLL